MHINTSEFMAKLINIKTKSTEQDSSVVFCHVDKVADLNLIELYTNRPSFAGEKFFWSNPSKTFLMCGFGVVKNFPKKPGLADFQSEMKAFSRRIKSTNDKVQFTPNLIAFGGFSFESCDGTFVIPKYLFVKNSEGCFLTTTYEINKETDLELLIRESEELLVETPATQISENALSSVNEIEVAQWVKNVEKTIQMIDEGLLEKVVLARALEVVFEDKIEAGKVLRNLYEKQPNCYLFSFEKGEETFVGASPEKLVSMMGRKVEAACLAGTIYRGDDEIEFIQNAKKLMNDKKNRKEHQYVVDFISRNLGELCEEICVPDLPQIMVNKHVQHLYTPIEGQAKRNMTILDLVKKLHPTPALGGTPTKEALRIIREFESFERGLFAAPIGWFDANGNGDFTVGIRSGILQDNVAKIYAGAGIVADSVPESEYAETAMKFRPMLAALGFK